MLRIGLISEHRTKPRRSFWVKYTTEVLLNKINPFELVVVTVPFNELQFRNLKEQKKIRIIESAVKMLKNQGVKTVLLSPFLKEYGANYDGVCDSDMLKKAMFPKWAYLCVKAFSQKCGIDLLNAKVCIRDSKWDRISEALIDNLCYDTRNLVVCTEDHRRVKAVCERFMEENGMHVRLADLQSILDSDVIIDVDSACVRIGRDLVIDGAAPEFDLGGFSVDLADVAGCVGEFVGFDGKIMFFSDKKKLTL